MQQCVDVAEGLEACWSAKASCRDFKRSESLCLAGPAVTVHICLCAAESLFEQHTDGLAGGTMIKNGLVAVRVRHGTSCGCIPTLLCFDQRLD
jgi:hypothetical protein